MTMDQIKFDADGLVPCVVQDFYTREVLTLAYMNRESLQISLAEGRTCFYSRARKCLWRKGESSGNVQTIVSLTADCDGDALTAEVIKTGPACHTGAESCFHRAMYGEKNTFSLAGLYALLCDRKSSRPAGSYTSYLFDKGKEKILKKVGEESAEVIIAAMKDSREETVYELADLAYHALVLMAEMCITPADIEKELASRHVVDKKVKQEATRA